MPSTVVLEKKKQQVADLAERIKGSCAGVVVDYKGINVEDDTRLRKELREAGVTYTVVKNSILQRAAEEAGLTFDSSVVEGTTAVATSKEDYVAAARILNKYAEEGKEGFNIKTGYLDGDVISIDEVVALAKLPSREGLLAQIASVVVEPIACIARAIGALEEKGGATKVEAEAPAEEAPVTQEAPAEETPATEEAPAEETAE